MKQLQISISQHEVAPQGAERGRAGMQGRFLRSMRPRGSGQSGIPDIALRGSLSGEDVVKNVLGNDALLSGARPAPGPRAERCREKETSGADAEPHDAPSAPPERSTSTTARAMSRPAPAH